MSSNAIRSECVDIFVDVKHSLPSDCVTIAHTSMGCDGSKDEFIEEEDEEELSEPKARHKRRPTRIPTGHQRRRKSPAASVTHNDELVYVKRPPTILAHDETEPSSVIDVRKLSSVKVQVNPERRIETNQVVLSLFSGAT